MADNNNVDDGKSLVYDLPVEIWDKIMDNLDVSDVKQVLQVPVLGTHANKKKFNAGSYTMRFDDDRVGFFSSDSWHTNFFSGSCYEDNTYLEEFMKYFKSLRGRFPGVIDGVRITNTKIPENVLNELIPRTVRVLHINIDDDNQWFTREEFKNLARYFNVPEFFSFHSPDHLKWKFRNKKLLKSEHLAISGSIVKIKSLFHFKNRILYCKVSDLKFEDVNNFLKNWQTARNPQLEVAVFKMDSTEKTRERQPLTAGLGCRIWKLAKGKKKYRELFLHPNAPQYNKIWKLNIKRGMDLKNVHGQVATIWITKRNRVWFVTGKRKSFVVNKDIPSFSELQEKILSLSPMFYD